jgi:hypothetical protein
VWIFRLAQKDKSLVLLSYIILILYNHFDRISLNTPHLMVHRWDLCHVQKFLDPPSASSQYSRSLLSAKASAAKDVRMGHDMVGTFCGPSSLPASSECSGFVGTPHATRK